MQLMPATARLCTAGHYRDCPAYAHATATELGDVAESVATHAVFGARPPVRLWNEMELEAVTSLPSLFDEVAGAARHELGESHSGTRRIEKGLNDERITRRERLCRWIISTTLASSPYTNGTKAGLSVFISFSVFLKALFELISFIRRLSF